MVLISNAQVSSHEKKARDDQENDQVLVEDELGLSKL